MNTEDPNLDRNFPFDLPADLKRRPVLYVVSGPVYQSWLELAASGLDGRNKDWDLVLHEKIANATDGKDAFHWQMVWEFGLRYGASRMDALEIDALIYREFQYKDPNSKQYIPIEDYLREDIAELVRAGQTQVYNLEIDAGPKP